MYEYTRRDMIKNKVTPGKEEVTFVLDKIKDARLRSLSHMKRRCMDAQVRRCERLTIVGIKRGRSKPKKKLGEVNIT